MSTVQQLSRSASERPFARSSAPGVRGRSGACRALFEPMDHEELEREMESKLLEMCERDRRRWNFDFETDTPLRGEYEWEAVGVGETPVFYRGSAVRGGARHSVIAATDRREPRETPPVTHQERTVLHGGSAGCPAMERLSIPAEDRVQPKAGAGVTQKNCSGKTNSAGGVGCDPSPRRRGSKRSRASAASGSTSSSTRMTDYYAKKRRSSEVKPGGDRASQPVALERTQRRRIR